MTSKINHPWTNGQVEKMNRTIKDTTVKRFHYDSHDRFAGTFGIHLRPGRLLAASTLFLPQSVR